jgi:DNA (cytosine-5)-methyltransferase 1
MNRIRVLDIFCGAGGLGLGFEKAGFRVTGVDISERAGETFELNSQCDFIKADLSKELIDGDYDIIIGGPPCKPWSAVNVTRRGKKHADYMLLSKYFNHIEYHSPDFFLFENVSLIAHDENLVKHIKDLEEDGYSVFGKTVVYGEYGAPTRRHRFIVFGTKIGAADRFFDKVSKYARLPRTVKDAIWNLRNKKKGEVHDHVWPELRTIEKYRDYYRTGKFGWYILNWNEPAPSFGNVMKTYILHPDSFSEKPARVISVKEALLIMGFDDNFRFPKGFGLGLRYQMVVDAVSPFFSSAAATAIREMINENVHS